MKKEEKKEKENLRSKYELKLENILNKTHFSFELYNKKLQNEIEFEKYFKNLKESNSLKYKLKSSDIFFYLYKTQIEKKNFKMGVDFLNKSDNDEYFNKINEECFKEAEKDYSKLKLLFEENWLNKIDKNIFKQICKIIKDFDDNKIKKELIIIKEYYELNLIDDLYINKLKDEIITYIKKEEVYEIVNNFVKSIEEKKKNKNEISFSFNQLNRDFIKIKNILELKEDDSENLIKKNKELLNDINEERKKNQNLNNQLIKLTDELTEERNLINKLNDESIIEKKKNQDLNSKLNEVNNKFIFEKNKVQDLNNQLKKVNEKLIFENNKNKNFQIKINELSESFCKEKENIKLSLEKFNDISNNINELKYKNEIYIKDLEINELKMKLSRYPFELNDKEEIISVIFISKDESVIFSVLCKNTDNFLNAVEKFYEKYPEYKGDSLFMVDNNIIDIYKNFIENNIGNNSIIKIIKE